MTSEELNTIRAHMDDPTQKWNILTAQQDIKKLLAEVERLHRTKAHTNVVKSKESPSPRNLMEQRTDCEVCGHTDHYAGVFPSGYVPYSGRLCYPCGAVRAESKWIKEEIESETGKESSIVTYEDGTYYHEGKSWITRDEVIKKLKEVPRG